LVRRCLNEFAPPRQLNRYVAGLALIALRLNLAGKVVLSSCCWVQI